MEFLLSVDLVRVYTLFKALNSIGYGILTDPVAWGLVESIQADGKIKQLLLGNYKLSRISLVDCCLSDAGASAIGQAIKKNTFLKELQLSTVLSTINLTRTKLEILGQLD